MLSVIVALNLFRASLLKVEYVDREADKVVMSDSNGFIWEWGDADDICEGEYYSAVFYTNKTDMVFDDAIVSIHYESEVE